MKDLPKLKERCQVRVLYPAIKAQQCCMRKAAGRVQHRRGETYRVCSVHKRMALDGLIDRLGVTLPERERLRLRRHGGPTPHAGMWRELDP